MASVAFMAAGAFADDGRLPKADPEKDLWQWTGYPPPGNMWLGGKCKRVTVDKSIAATEGERSADMWQDLAKWSAIGALVLTALWYFSSKRELGGAAGVALLCSLGCTIMAEIVTHAGWIALFVVGILIILFLGYKWRDKSIWTWWKTRKEKTNKAEDAEGEQTNDRKETQQ
jgi:hypothetical protein